MRNQLGHMFTLGIMWLCLYYKLFNDCCPLILEPPKQRYLVSIVCLPRDLELHDIDHEYFDRKVGHRD